VQLKKQTNTYKHVARPQILLVGLTDRAIKMHFLKVLSGFVFLIHSVYSNNSSQSVSLIYQFQNKGSWAENLVERPNGQLLVTRTDVPELWLIDPSQKTGTLLKAFANVTGMLGITETGLDQYAIIGSQIQLATVSVAPGSNKVFPLTFQGPTPLWGDAISIGSAQFLNGMATFNAQSSIVLLADSGAGVLYKLDLRSGAYSIAIDDPTMKKVGSSPIGINGVKVLRNYVYYTSSSQSLFCRVPVDGNVTLTGPVQVVANTTGYFLDDFDIGKDGTAWIATNPNNEILKVTTDGKYTVVAGSATSLDVAGATAALLACAEGRTGQLYVTTNGGQVAPVNGSVIEPAKVVVVNV
jgi:hypothetical protein